MGPELGREREDGSGGANRSKPTRSPPTEAVGTPVTLQLSLPATVTLEAAYQVGGIIKMVELSLSLINLA